MDDLDQMRKEADRALEGHRLAAAMAKSEKAGLAAAKAQAGAAAEAQKIVQKVAQAVQRRAHEQISRVVTRCIRAVYPDGYDFHIAFERKRGKTEARLVFLKDGHEVSPTGAAGGGVVDVAALALRLACLLLATPRRRRLVVLDEPFRFVNGREYQERVAQLIPTLARELGFQFIIVTDDDWMKIGTVIDLGSMQR